VSRKVRKQTRKQEDEKIQKALSDPWLSMRTGLIGITIVSIALAAWTFWQTDPSIELIDRILYGLLFGGSVWFVFFGFYLFNRLIRRRK
jgi:hypothetical protein